jgi:DNA processing protein
MSGDAAVRAAADERTARATWSRLAEPGDTVAGALVAVLGARDALEWVADVLSADRSTVSIAAGPPAAHVPARSFDRLTERSGPLDDAMRRRLAGAVVRWGTRWDSLDVRRDLDLLDRLGGSLTHPGLGTWPVALDDLGAAAPPCLWVRGAPDVGALVSRSVALVGARASTAYGDHVATDLAVGLADRRFTVVSGGAYGIDAAAHRGAVVAGAPTVVLLAGGMDRPYPAGNAQLLRRVVEVGGAVVSEVPPGSVPSRTRFLLRNRLIAAAGRATVVVEAAWRPGALSTAAHAGALLRPVGAVPGPVTSMASSGCHRILRDGSAVCVTDAAEVAELAGDLGADLAPERHGTARDTDGLGVEARRVVDAVPVVRAAPVASIARAAGMAEHEVRGVLGVLELEGLAVQRDGGWVRRRRTGIGTGTGTGANTSTGPGTGVGTGTATGTGTGTGSGTGSVPRRGAGAS